MLAAMIAAAVGDDVFGEDPTVNELEAGRRAVRQGSRRCSSPRARWRTRSPSASTAGRRTSAARIDQPHLPVGGRRPGGPQRRDCARSPAGTASSASATSRARSAANDMHAVRTRRVCLENTHNRGGGTVYPLDAITDIPRWAKANGLAMHLDGARMWNAIVATGVPRESGPRTFDTRTVCFSKGLGAPVGSALLGPKRSIATPAGPQAVRRGDAAGRVPRGRVPVRDGPPRRAAGGGPRQRADHREGGATTCRA